MKYRYPVKTAEQKEQDRIWFEETLRILKSGEKGVDCVNHSGFHFQPCIL